MLVLVLMLAKKNKQVVFKIVNSKLILDGTYFQKCLRGARKTCPGFNTLLIFAPI